MGICGLLVGQSSGTLPTKVQNMVFVSFSGFFFRKPRVHAHVCVRWYCGFQLRVCVRGTRVRSVVLRVFRALEARESLPFSSLCVYRRIRVRVCVRMV